MLTFVLIAIGILLLAILLIGYSSKAPRIPAPPRGSAPTDVSLDPDRRRATGKGED
jgi:hypothetical protein